MTCDVEINHFALADNSVPVSIHYRPVSVQCYHQTPKYPLTKRADVFVHMYTMKGVTFRVGYFYVAVFTSKINKSSFKY